MATKKTGSSAPAKRARSTSTSSSRANKPASDETSTEETESTGGSDGRATRRESSAPRAAAPKRMSGPQVAQAAVRQLIELAGKQPEGVTGLQRTEDGWTVQVEVLEVRRVPDTTDVLSSYEVEMDTDGDLLGYRRLRRYVRGVPGES